MMRSMVCINQISDLGRKSGDCASATTVSLSRRKNEREIGETHAENLAAEPRMQLDGKLVRLGRGKVRAKEHHA